MRNLGIYIDAQKKVFDRLEQVNERVVIGFYTVGR